MSTRASILCKDGFHIYLETSHEDICISFPDPIERSVDKELLKRCGYKLNEYYGDMILSREFCIELRDELNEFLKNDSWKDVK